MLGGSKEGRGRVGYWMGEGCKKVKDTCLDAGNRGCSRHGDFRWKPGECVRNALGACGPNPHTVAAIVV